MLVLSKKHHYTHSDRKQSVNSLGDAIVDSNGCQILWNKPLLAVTLDDTALKNKQYLKMSSTAFHARPSIKLRFINFLMFLFR